MLFLQLHACWGQYPMHFNQNRTVAELRMDLLPMNSAAERSMQPLGTSSRLDGICLGHVDPDTRRGLTPIALA